MRSSFEPDAPLSRSRRFEAEPLHRDGASFEPADPEPEPPTDEAPPTGVPVDEHERAVAAARVEGEAAGRAALPWTEAEALERATQALTAAAAALTELRGRYLAQQRGAIVELAIAIAERLLEREVKLDPGVLVPLVERALAVVPAGAELHVRLATADHAALVAGGALAPLAERTGAQFHPDPSLAPGDVQVDAGASGVDATRIALLERVRAELEPLVTLAEPAADEEDAR